MSNRSLLFLCSLILSLSFPAYSADYYLSTSRGKDTNAGTKKAPWKTIERINQETFASGDKIFFKRGEVFRGEIKSYKIQPNLSFGAYGTGDNPVISGSLPITKWKPTTHGALPANVYEADVSSLITVDAKGNENTLEHLFVNGELMTIARYPNVDKPSDANWLKVGKSAGTDSFTDSTLANYSRPDGYWKDARLRIRTYSWYYRVFKITNYKATSGKITAKGLGNQLPEWGYFLDDKLEELDHPGEWYYDAATKKVYLYPLANKDPNRQLIEGTTYRIGLTISQQENNTVVEDLTFRHFTSIGLSLANSDSVLVRNCLFEYNNKGISVWQMTNSLITGNTLNNQFSIGVIFNGDKTLDMKNSTIVEKNEINNTGMIPVYCKRYEGTCYGIGMNVFGKGQYLRQNTINKTGWTGIYLKAGGHHLVEHNVVKNALSLINDGGAISIGSDANTIRGNFLIESIGNVGESNGCMNLNKTPCAHHSSYGMGIGSDSKFTRNLIEDNTIANNPDIGIRLNAFTDSVVRNNTLYNNDPQIRVEDTMGFSRSNVFEGNIAYSLTPEQRGLVLTGTVEHGTFDNKFFCNPYQDIIFERKSSSYSLADWRTAFPTYEKNATVCNIGLNEYNVTNASGINLLTTTNFQMALQTSKSTALLTNRFSLQKDQQYRLKFNALGSAEGSVRVRVNHAPSGETWDVLKESIFAYNSTNKENELVFSVPYDTNQALLNFSSTKKDENGADSLSLDNIFVETVNATLNDASKQSTLFTNTTEHEKIISLEGTVYKDLEGQEVSTSLILQPFSSKILNYVSGRKPPTLGNLRPLSMTLELNGRTVSVTWEISAEAEGYRLYYAPKPYTGPASIKSIDVKSQASFSVELPSEFPSDSAFYVAVKAYNKLGESDYSNIESFITP
jgi:parallel beta-helix repeat protein